MKQYLLDTGQDQVILFKKKKKMFVLVCVCLKKKKAYNQWAIQGVFWVVLAVCGR